MQHTTPQVSLYLKRFCSCALAAVLTLSLCPGFGIERDQAHAVTAAEKQAEAEAALANLNAMQETLDRLSMEYGDALAAQAEAESSRDAAAARIEELEGRIDELQDRLGERAREMYRNGNVSFLEILLDTSTFEEFATSLDMVNKVNANDAAMVAEQKELEIESQQQYVTFTEQTEVATQKAEEAAEAERQAQATVAEMQATYDSLSAEAAQLLEEERKAREAEEAARAAAIVEASARAAEEQARQEAARAQAERAAAVEADEDEEADDEYADEDERLDDEEKAASTDEDEYSGEEDEYADKDEEADDSEEEEAVEPDEDAEADESEEGEPEAEEEAAEPEPAPEPEPEPEPYNAAEDTTVTAFEGGSDTVSRAYACLGAPYVWGGVGPEGYDCSGLVSYCLCGSHTRLGTTSTFMGWPQVSDPQPGDIAVNWGHTGVYIGGGQMIHAATYGVGVIVGPVQDGMIIVRWQG